MIQWIQEPTDTNTLRDFQQWKEKCDVKVIFSYFCNSVAVVLLLSGFAISKQFVLALI